MNKYTIPNLIRFKKIESLSALRSVGEYRNNNKGFAILAGRKIKNHGQVLITNLKYVSEATYGKAYAEKNDGSLILFDIYNGEVKNVVFNKELSNKDNIYAEKIEEGILLSDKNNTFYIIYNKTKELSDPFISYSDIKNSLRIIYPKYIDGVLNKDLYYYVNANGVKSSYIKDETVEDEFGNKIVKGLTDKYYLVHDYRNLTMGYDKIEKFGKRYIVTKINIKKSALGTEYKEHIYRIIDSKGNVLNDKFDKYYIFNGDLLVRPAGSKNYKLLDGNTLIVKQENIAQPRIAEKYNLIYCKQKGVPTIIGDGVRENKEIDSNVAIAVMNKLNNQRIPSSIIDNITKRNVNIDPTLDKFYSVISFNKMIAVDNDTLKNFDEKTIKSVRSALLNSTRNRIKKYNKLLYDINEVKALTEEFKQSLGKSKYARKKRNVVKKEQDHTVESFEQLEIDMSDIDGYKQIQMDLSDTEDQPK